MLRIYACLTAEHDPVTLVLAVLILLAAASSAMFIARKSVRRPDRHWPLLAGFVLGAGAWSTHFVAMLGYAPEIPITYDIGITLGSAVLGILGAATGITLWSRSRGLARRALGGALVGAAVAGMHYLGMAGLVVPGTILWSPTLIAVSVLAGVLFFMLAFLLLRADGTLLAPALWVVTGVATLHFTGMAAAVLVPDSTPQAVGSALPRGWLAALVAGVTLTWLVTGLTVQVTVGRQRRQQRRREMDRFRALADASPEGIALCDAEGRIRDVNASFGALLGRPADHLAGQRIDTLLVLDPGTEPLTGLLDGRIPVGVQRREIETAEGPRTVHALRDLRERIASENRISHLARHDPLTGAANRAALTEDLGALLARPGPARTPFAVLAIDLDRFKAVNEVHGHAQGDRILAEVVLRLRSQAARGDLVARLGSDEFAFVAPGVTTVQEAVRLARRLVGLLQIGVDGAAAELVTASIGVAMYPADATTPEALLRAAGLAAYRARAAQGNRFALYEAGLDEELRQAQMLELDLRQALPRGELSLEFQPIAATPGPTVIGFETLVRWTHPGRGRVSPEVFIPVAERSGAILAIGEWVLRTACAEAAAWANPLTVAVNVSPVQVGHAGFAATVAAILAQTGLAPGRLELEVTESLFIAETAQVGATLEAIRALGVRIALDDFGTGYSSLATLRNFPFDKVKIDRSFTMGLGQDRQADAIVSGVLALASGLGLRVVAEGVESDFQLDRLRAQGCFAVQGYLIGKPRPIEAYAALTAEMAPKGTAMAVETASTGAAMAVETAPNGAAMAVETAPNGAAMAAE